MEDDILRYDIFISGFLSEAQSAMINDGAVPLSVASPEE